MGFVEMGGAGGRFVIDVIPGISKIDNESEGFCECDFPLSHRRNSTKKENKKRYPSFYSRFDELENTSFPVSNENDGNSVG